MAHTRHVRLLKLTLAVGSAAVGLLVAGDLAANLRREREVKEARVTVNGTSVTVRSPRVTGLLVDGRRLEVGSEIARGDTTRPGSIELFGIDASITERDASIVRVRASHGSLDLYADKLAVDGGILIADSKGQEMRIRSAVIDLTHGALTAADVTQDDELGKAGVASAMLATLKN